MSRLISALMLMGALARIAFLATVFGLALMQGFEFAPVLGRWVPYALTATMGMAISLQSVNELNTTRWNMWLVVVPVSILTTIIVTHFGSGHYIFVEGTLVFPVMIVMATLTDLVARRPWGARFGLV